MRMYTSIHAESVFYRPATSGHGVVLIALVTLIEKMDFFFPQQVAVASGFLAKGGTLCPGRQRKKKKQNLFFTVKHRHWLWWLNTQIYTCVKIHQLHSKQCPFYCMYGTLSTWALGNMSIYLLFYLTAYIWKILKSQRNNMKTLFLS